MKRLQKVSNELACTVKNWDLKKIYFGFLKFEIGFLKFEIDWLPLILDMSKVEILLVIWKHPEMVLNFSWSLIELMDVVTTLLIK